MVCGALCLFVAGCSLSQPAQGQTQAANSTAAGLPDAPARLALDTGGQQAESSLGTISGTVIDPNGNYVVSARVTLMRDGHPLVEETSPDAQGQYRFTAVPAGAFVVVIGAEGFANRELPGVLLPGEAIILPQVTLMIAAASTDVEVRVTNYELAEEQVKIEETQRVFGVIPNFYVSYQQNPLPLRPKQKFELAWKSNVDLVTIAATGAVAGVEQAQNGFSGYGQGTQGYAKRFGAAYADGFIGTMIGGAILPSLLKQDPRYFYKGTGTIRSRIFYALANAVICKGDNGHWQADVSGIAGSLAAAGISNLYYPASSRHGAGLTFENTFIGVGSSGIANLFQEFLVRKLTPHAGSKP
jgi:hypothetical protein